MQPFRLKVIYFAWKQANRPGLKTKGCDSRAAYRPKSVPRRHRTRRRLGVGAQAHEVEQSDLGCHRFASPHRGQRQHRKPASCKREGGPTAPVAIVGSYGP